MTYYVSTTGNDNNAGTLGAPWRTIQKAANTVHAGDTVQVRAGTYNEIVTMKTSGNATAGYITFQNYPGEAPIVDGTGLAGAAARSACSASKGPSATSSFKDSRSGTSPVPPRARCRSASILRVRAATSRF